MLKMLTASGKCQRKIFEKRATQNPTSHSFFEGLVLFVFYQNLKSFSGSLTHKAFRSSSCCRWLSPPPLSPRLTWRRRPGGDPGPRSKVGERQSPGGASRRRSVGLASISGRELFSQTKSGELFCWHCSVVNRNDYSAPLSFAASALIGPVAYMCLKQGISERRYFSVVPERRSKFWNWNGTQFQILDLHNWTKG